VRTPPVLGATVTVREIGDDGWDDDVRGVPLDPTCTRPFLAASAVARAVRPVLVSVTTEAWSARYPLVLADVGGGRWLARTPEYGGPVIMPTATPATVVAAELRRTLDDLLRELGVVSEVMLLGPWLAHRHEIASAWACRPDKTICLVPLRDLDARRSRLSPNMRRDIAQTRRRAQERWMPFDPTVASEFAARYAEHMDRLAAEARWRLDAPYFGALADGTADAWLAEASDERGGASCLVVISGARASYVYGTRWGRGGSTTTLALWRAQEELSARAVDELLLGGGVTCADDDSLLAFKRRFAPREDRLWIGARAFDVDAHDAVVARGDARPLPEGFVRC
jgi:hypothetical protein